MDNSKVLSEIQYLQKRIERCYQKKDEPELLRYLKRIKKLPIRIDHLKETKVEKSVEKLRNLNGKVREAATALLNQWLEIKLFGDFKPDAISSEIKWCKDRLKKYSDLKDNLKLVYYLKKLRKLPVTFHHLQHSNIDVSVFKLCGCQDDVGKIAQSLYRKLISIKLFGDELTDLDAPKRPRGDESDEPMPRKRRKTEEKKFALKSKKASKENTTLAEKSGLEALMAKLCESNKVLQRTGRY